ncbi:MAG: hypothetical protein JF589_15995 [Gemmatimonadetes bacterium]|nr:hypothetical protein [Gemmatimonadota bacterium]
MTYFLLVFIVSIAGAMFGWRTGGARWCIAGGAGIGLVAGVARTMGLPLFLAENGWVAFLVVGLPSVLVGLCAAFAVLEATRRIPE